MKRLCILLLLILTSCPASTRLTGAWKDVDFHGRIHQVLVIGISGQETTRKMYENAFAEALASYGVRAVPGYKLIRSDEVEKEAEIMAKARGAGVDSVLITKVISIDKEKEQVTDVDAYGPEYDRFYTYGRTYPYSYRPRYGSWYQDYYGSYTQVRSYTVEYRVASLETTLYDFAGGGAVWSALSRTVTMDTLAEEIDGIVKALVERLAADGLI